MSPVIYTIGHGTRSRDELLDILQAFSITLLVDVRSYPNSRTNPQFNSEPFAEFLEAHGIAYRSMGSTLGGRRKKQPSSLQHSALRVAAFQNYAAYMTSPEWQQGIHELCAAAASHALAYMCSETLWWRCHRRLISDYLVLHGWQVYHLGIKKDEAIPHALWDIARQTPEGAIVYDQNPAP